MRSLLGRSVSGAGGYGIWPADSPSERMKRRPSETTRHEAIKHDKAPNPHVRTPTQTARGLRARAAYLTNRRLCPQPLHKRHVATLRAQFGESKAPITSFFCFKCPSPPEPPFRDPVNCPQTRDRQCDSPTPSARQPDDAASSTKRSWNRQTVVASRPSRARRGIGDARSMV